MAHFAELDQNNIVKQIIVVHNDELLENDIESEQKGINFCVVHYGGTWVQTSYNGNIRKNYAGIGMFYDQTRDAFISEKPYLSWVLNEDTCQWQAPIPYPDDDKKYLWNEETLSWDKVTI